MKAGEDIVATKTFFDGLRGGIGDIDRAHHAQIGWPLGGRSQINELLYVVDIVNRCLFFQERTGAGAARLVHVAFDDTAALDPDVLGVLAANLDHRQIGPAIHITARRAGGVGDDFVQYDNIVVVGIDRAQQRGDGFPARTGNADGTHVGLGLRQYGHDQTAGGIDRVAPGAVVNVEHDLAGFDRGQDSLGPGGAEIKAQNGWRLRHAGGHFRFRHHGHMLLPAAGRCLHLEAVLGRRDQFRRFGGQGGEGGVSRLFGGDRGGAHGLETLRQRRHLYLFAQHLFERAAEALDPRRPAHQVNRAADPVAHQQGIGVAGDGAEIALEQITGGLALVGEMGHLGFGENRATRGDGNGLVGCLRRLVRIVNAQAETVGDLLDIFACTGRAFVVLEVLVVILRPHAVFGAILPLGRFAAESAIAAGADGYQVQGVFKVWVDLKGGFLTGILGQNQDRLAQFIGIDAGRGQSGTGCDIVVVVPLLEQAQGIAFVQFIASALYLHLTVFSHRGGYEPHGRLAQITASYAHDYSP